MSLLIQKDTEQVIFGIPELEKLRESIRKTISDHEFISLYKECHSHLKAIFHEFTSPSAIRSNRNIFALCFEWLSLFMRKLNHKNEDRTSNEDDIEIILNDLTDNFIDHLSRVEEVLGDNVEQEYLEICFQYAIKVEDKKDNVSKDVYHKWDSFLPKIFPTLQRILERGSKEKLGDALTQSVLKILNTLSKSPSSSTRSSIFTLIKPYIRDWLRIFNSECLGQLMVLLSQITLSSDDETPDKSLCSEAWPFFHPVLDVVKREFVGNKIVKDKHEYVFLFFANLCCDPSHAIEIYDNVKDLLDESYDTIMEKGYYDYWAIHLWSYLIAKLSTVPSLVPQVSLKYDAKMTQFSMFYVYLFNIYSYLSTYYLPKLLHSIPPVSLIPSIETSLCPEKDGYSFASHVCCVMNLKIDDENVGRAYFVNIITKKRTEKERKSHQIIKRGSVCVNEKKEDRIQLSSIIQYTPPQHLLVKMPLDEERALRQSVYDHIEFTGGEVESLFDPDDTFQGQFEGYDQEEWREGMIMVEETGEEEGEEEEEEE
ncbi:hypothetical protein ADUPG1_006676 [Aduncisulcus paluster]|uniref:Uncharacterized protein n=1 Tax=Aduncisulcus paluster TaxID=2918883 RepID=A0ABQ5KM40_9EUKA|nr:hypothetical protein ADUPG1_006676 [Aduncisulcus paluster]